MSDFEVRRRNSSSARLASRAAFIRLDSCRRCSRLSVRACTEKAIALAFARSRRPLNSPNKFAAAISTAASEGRFDSWTSSVRFHARNCRRRVRRFAPPGWTRVATTRCLGDNAYDSDKLDAQLRHYGIEVIAPHRSNRRIKTQDERCLRRYRRRWKIERLFAWLQNFRRLVVRYERHDATERVFHCVIPLHGDMVPCVVVVPSN